MEQLARLAELGNEEQKQVDSVIATLTSIGERDETVAEIAHDVRNMVTALDLYCDLLQQPGVLAEPFVHYGGELRLVAAASRRLVEKLTDGPAAEPGDARQLGIDAAMPGSSISSFRISRGTQWKSIPAEAVRNVAEELLENRYLLASLVGPTVALTVDVQGGALPIRMTSEDLTRVLVNLAKNAAEAMRGQDPHLSA